MPPLTWRRNDSRCSIDTSSLEHSRLSSESLVTELRGFGSTFQSRFFMVVIVNSPVGPRRVHLEDAATLIESLVPSWSSRGIDVDVVISRGSTSPEVPDVVGIKTRRGTMSGRMMLFSGGWADFEFSSGLGDDRLRELHPLSDASVHELATDLLDRMSGSFDQSAPSSRPDATV